MAKTVLKACDGAGKGAYHFSSGKDVAIKDLYDAVVKAMCINDYPEPDVIDLGPDDVFSILLDPSKTFKDFGEIEFTPIEDTVSEAIEYFQEFGTLGEYTHLKLHKKEE